MHLQIKRIRGFDDDGDGDIDQCDMMKMMALVMITICMRMAAEV